MPCPFDSRGHMARPDNWIDLIEPRIAAAKALGWEAVDVGRDDYHFWIMNDPQSHYSGTGDSEYEAFWDIVADAELWDEVTAALNSRRRMNPDNNLIEGFARSWEQAMRGETFPIATLWDEVDSDVLDPRDAFASFADDWNDPAMDGYDSL